MQQMAPWIQTFDNQKFDLLEPDPATIDPETLSTVLGRICRFGGHCRHFYSVAQHSALVESLINDPELKLPALLHDAHEAYWGFGDVCRPAKNLTRGIRDSLKDHSRIIDVAIAIRFGFDPMLFYCDEIKHADNVLLATEQRDVMGPPPFPWVEMPDPMPREILYFQPPDIAGAFFQHRLTELLAQKPEV